MPSLTLAAPAKINLYLEILGRRADGFHALETVFQTIALHDVVMVSVETGAGVTLTCSDASLPCDAGNLAWRAAAAFLARRPGWRVDIRLDKRIPHGAGLGGGSSDAAAVLRACQRLIGGLEPATLADLALELGSDVPFFLVGGTAHATGRGEELTALPDAGPQAVTVLMPEAHLPTPSVFKALTESERGPRTVRGAAWAAAQRPAELLFNRLAAPARRLCPPADATLGWLETQGLPCLLSGSGAACFCLGTVAPPAGVRGFSSGFRSRSDLDDWTA